MRTMKAGLITLILSILGSTLGGTLGSAPGALAAHAETTAIQCDFGDCSAEIIQDSSLEVTCENRLIYKGPYVLNTSFRTIRIESAMINGPHIMTQSLPTSKAPSKAILFLSGTSMNGVCSLAKFPSRDF